MEYSNLLKGIGIGLLIGLSVFLLYNFGLESGVSKDKVGKRVKEVYSLSNPNQNVEISSVTEENGLYKVIIKSNTQLQEVYVTQNGKFLIRKPTKLEGLRERLSKTQDFTNCLKNKNVRLYGISNQTATQAQIQILGGVNFASQIYQSCAGQNAQGCVQNGVKKVPSIKYKDQVLEGVNRVSKIANITGCEFKG